MTNFAEQVTIGRRFQKAIRIDSDLDKAEALEGYICPQSSADVLTSMASHVAENKHGAFTWTGPYGSGKSSLILILSALLSSDKKLRSKAEGLVGAQTAKAFRQGFPIDDGGWVTVAAVGRRSALPTILGDAILEAKLNVRKPARWTDESLLKALQKLLESPKQHRIILFADELGKVLESAAQEGGDLHLLQQIAELASRSEGRLVFVGVLHQAFDEYANRMARETRDEWSKIQGRFVDLIVNTAGEEQIDLLSRAIESKKIPEKFDCKVEAVTKELPLPSTSTRNSLNSLLGGMLAFAPCSSDASWADFATPIWSESEKPLWVP